MKLFELLKGINDTANDLLEEEEFIKRLGFDPEEVLMTKDVRTVIKEQTHGNVRGAVARAQERDWLRQASGDRPIQRLTPKMAPAEPGAAERFKIAAQETAGVKAGDKIMIPGIGLADVLKWNAAEKKWTVGKGPDMYSVVEDQLVGPKSVNIGGSAHRVWMFKK